MGIWIIQTAADMQYTINMKEESMELYGNIGRKIRGQRKLLGITLEELGEKVHRDWSYLSQVERGKAVPSIDTLVRISEALEISLAELFENTKKPKKYEADPFVSKVAYMLRDKDAKYKKSLAKFLYNTTKKK